MRFSEYASLLGVVAVLCTVAALYVHATFARPEWIRNALAFSLGALPLAKIPVVGVPFILALTAALAVCTVVRAARFDRFARIEFAIIGLIAASAFSVAPNLTGVIDLRLFLQWLAATLITLLLLRLGREQLHQFGRWFVYGATLCATVGLISLVKALPAVITTPLRFIGYDQSSLAYRNAVGDGVEIHRLAGTIADPNAAAVLLLVATCVAAVVFHGWRRTGFMLLLLVATALTLSRAIGLSVAAAVLVLLIFSPMARRDRWYLSAAAGTVAIAAILVPATRNRMLSSFTAGDVGSSARWDSLVAYPQIMNGRWIFGVGWGRPEFWDPTTAFLTNYVSNAPLVAIYRGGIVVGIAFAVVVGFGIAASYRGVRSGRWDLGILGAGFIGFVVVGMQLDHPIVTSPPVVSVFAVLLAFLVDSDRALSEARGVRPQRLSKESLDAGPAALARLR